jgi:cytoskeletal protein RodZ
MLMKNMNEKTKKRLILAGGILISAVLIFMIGTRFQQNPVKDTSMVAPTNGTDKVVVDGSKTESTEKQEVTVPAIATTPQPKAEAGGDDTGTEQTIHPDIPEKPTYTEEQLKDPTQKPSGEKVDPPKEEDKKPVTPTKPAQTTTQNTSGGLPGFDSVPDGGANQVINGTDMYENGNKIGNMN